LGDIILTAMPTSEELLELADQAAKKVDLDAKMRHIPSFSDAEEQCEDEYEDLLQAIHDDEVFESVDVERRRRWSSRLLRHCQRRNGR
jgi:hypothetical protein